MTTNEEHSFRNAFPIESYPQYYERRERKEQLELAASDKPVIKQEVRWIADIVAWRLRSAFQL